MRVAISSYGTRGDFQPFLALALELRHRGHEVKFYTCESHGKMATDSGFSYLRVPGGDAEEGLRKPSARLAMEKGDFALVAAKTDETATDETTTGESPPPPDDTDELKELISKDIVDFKPDFIVHNKLGSLEQAGTEAPDVPRIEIELQPQVVPSQHWKSMGFQRELPDPDTPNILTHLWLIPSNTLDFYQKLQSEGADKEMFFRVLDTCPTPEAIYEEIFEPDKRLMPLFLAYSPSMMPPPDDWPKSDKLKIIGNLKVNKEQQKESASKGSKFFASGSDYDKCVEFIAQGTPPVYIGWGSMTVYSKQHMTMLAVRALKQAGERGIILGGWAQLGFDGLDGAKDEEELKAWCQDNVRFASALPHELLFAQCKACVHHGGIGTLHASLSAGCPTIITPVWADQFDNAKHLASIECGLATTRLGKLKPGELGDAIKTICSDKKFKPNATLLALKMQQESATATLADWMEKFLAEEVQSGNYKKMRTEWKERLYQLRQKNARQTFQQLQAGWTAKLNKYPTAKEFATNNLKFMTKAAGLVPEGRLWWVKESSALARSGEGLKTPEVGRFKRFAFLEELGKDKKGSRIHVRKMKGRGPEEGWVSTTVNGNDMICKVQSPAEIGAIKTAEWNAAFSDVL